MNALTSTAERELPAQAAQPLVLVSHRLCPYVQRAAIVLAEKGIAFERRDIDLAAKPDWFLAISPLGKTPVLLVGEQAIFESAVICEYLDEVNLPSLHPVNALQRARHRSWMVFGSQVLDGIAALYGAPDEASMELRVQDLRSRFEQLEAVLTSADGPYFAGAAFSLVDAVFGPVFRYFDVIDPLLGQDLWQGLPRVQAWRAALAARPSVRSAVSPSYPAWLRTFIQGRDAALGRRIAEPAVA